MNWNTLNKPEMLAEVKEFSKTQKVLIFKHSTSCNISSTALNRLERAWKNEEMTHIKPYFLDLLRFREISNQIAQEFGITHQSPQVIIIENEKAIFDASHLDINYAELKELSQ